MGGITNNLDIKTPSEACVKNTLFFIEEIRKNLGTKVLSCLERRVSITGTLFLLFSHNNRNVTIEVSDNSLRYSINSTEDSQSDLSISKESIQIIIEVIQTVLQISPQVSKYTNKKLTYEEFRALSVEDMADYYYQHGGWREIAMEYDALWTSEMAEDWRERRRIRIEKEIAEKNKKNNL